MEYLGDTFTPEVVPTTTGQSNERKSIPPPDNTGKIIAATICLCLLIFGLAHEAIKAYNKAKAQIEIVK